MGENKSSEKNPGMNKNLLEAIQEGRPLKTTRGVSKGPAKKGIFDDDAVRALLTAANRIGKNKKNSDDEYSDDDEWKVEVVEEPTPVPVKSPTNTQATTTPPRVVVTTTPPRVASNKPSDSLVAPSNSRPNANTSNTAPAAQQSPPFLAEILKKEVKLKKSTGDNPDNNYITLLTTSLSKALEEYDDDENDYKKSKTLETIINEAKGAINAEKFEFKIDVDLNAIKRRWGVNTDLEETGKSMLKLLQNALINTKPTLSDRKDVVLKELNSTYQEFLKDKQEESPKYFDNFKKDWDKLKAATEENIKKAQNSSGISTAVNEFDKKVLELENKHDAALKHDAAVTIQKRFRKNQDNRIQDRLNQESINSAIERLNKVVANNSSKTPMPDYLAPRSWEAPTIGPSVKPAPQAVVAAPGSQPAAVVVVPTVPQPKPVLETTPASTNKSAEKINHSRVSVKLAVQQTEPQKTIQDILATPTSSSKNSRIPRLNRQVSNNSKLPPMAEQPPSTITSSPSKKPPLSRTSKIPLPTNKLSTLPAAWQQQTLTPASKVQQTEPQKPMEQQLPTTTPLVQSEKIFTKPKVLPKAPIRQYNEEERQFPNNRPTSVRKISRSPINKSNKPFTPKNQPTFQTRMSEGLESTGSIKDVGKIQREDDFWNALHNGLTIEAQDPIVWCSKNKYLIEDIDPIIYAIQNKIEIEGKHAFQYALDNGLTIEGKHPIVSCAERGIKIRKIDPILWAADNGYKINGETPIEYAINNRIQIEQQNPILWAFRQKDPKIKGLVERVTVTINPKNDGFVKSLNTKIPSEPRRRQ